MIYEVSVRGKTYRIELQRVPASSPAPSQSSGRETNSHWNIRIDGRELSADCRQMGNGSLSLLMGGDSFHVQLEPTGEEVVVHLRGKAYECSVRDSRSLRSRKRAGSVDDGAQEIKASMPGKVVRILAQVGETVAAGQGLLVIEAMKMQNEVRAPRNGLLKRINASEGANVNAGEVLAVIE